MPLKVVKIGLQMDQQGHEILVSKDQHAGLCCNVGVHIVKLGHAFPAMLLLP